MSGYGRPSRTRLFRRPVRARSPDRDGIRTGEATALPVELFVRYLNAIGGLISDQCRERNAIRHDVT